MDNIRIIEWLSKESIRPVCVWVLEMLPAHFFERWTIHARFLVRRVAGIETVRQGEIRQCWSCCQLHRVFVWISMRSGTRCIESAVMIIFVLLQDITIQPWCVGNPIGIGVHRRLFLRWRSCWFRSSRRALFVGHRPSSREQALKMRTIRSQI